MAEEQARSIDDHAEALETLGEILAADHVLATIIAASGDGESLETPGERLAADHLLDAVGRRR